MNTLIIRCRANPDWNGKWFRSDVTYDMIELGIQPNRNEWQWVLDHVFDDVNVKWPYELIESETIRKMSLIIKGMLVEIEIY